MPLGDPVTRYFRHVYPALRGERGDNPITRLTRRLTEPGQHERIAWVLRMLANTGPLRVLDAGCGQGAYAVALARRGHEVTGVDLSGHMLRAARRAARTAGVTRHVHLVQADLRAWTPRCRFDAILCMGVIEYYADPAPFLRRLYAWTDGPLLLSMTKTGTGARGVVRRTWLLLNRLSARAVGPADLAALLGALSGASVHRVETGWTHCAAACHPAPAAAARTAAAGN